MPYRLLKNALNAALLALLPSFFSVSFLFAQDDPPSDVLAYKGTIDSLRNDGILSIALRSDGRYLFVSEGGKAFNALDLQDMGLLGPGAQADENVVDVFMGSATELVVTHEEGVQYFDVSSPFDIEEIDAQYTRPTEASNLDVIDSCWIANRRTALLEDSTSNQHLLRVVDGNTQAGTVSWSTLFPQAPQQLTPWSVHCTPNAIYVVAMESGFAAAEEIRIARVSASGLSASSATFKISDYLVEDFIVSAKGDQLFVLFNRETPTDDPDDSKILPIDAGSLQASASINVGSDAKALSSFQDGDDFILGVFVGEDRLEDNTTPDANKLLLAMLPINSAQPFQEDRGDGSADVGLRKPSIWVSTKSDHYKYGLSGGSGIALVGKGPLITVTERPSAEKITQSVPLTFSFSTDRRVQYQLRLDQNYEEDGTSAGLSREPGILIQSGTLLEDAQTETFSFTTSALSLSKDRRMSLSILAWDPELGDTNSPMSRVGIPFTYDPPPGEVLNLRLRFGDQSIHIYFDPPTGGDIASYLVDYSYTESDLDSFTGADRSFESGISGYTLTSPKEVLAPSFGGKIVLSPLQNYRTVYFRVYAVDKSNQITQNPTTQTGQGYNTLTVPNAVGGVASCYLNPHRQLGGSKWAAFFELLALLGLIFLIRWKRSLRF